MESSMGWLLVCLHLLLFHFPSSHSLCHSHDSFALLQFNTSFTIDTTVASYERDDAYPKTATWKRGTDCCSWLGVTCHPVSGHVIGLDLSCSGLQGIIHPNSTLFHLSHLQSLNLASNDFSQSPFSFHFGGLTSLTHLNLSRSNFEGEIPSQISYLSKLTLLDLSLNDKLKWKETTLKRFVQNTTILRELVFDRLNMSSIHMRAFNNLSSSLVTLGLEFTSVTGNLTNDILCLPNLQHLYLSNNPNLKGQLPNLRCKASLRILDLSCCKIQGSIPPSFGNLTHLTSLDLSVNNLDGSIPSSLLNLPRITFLDLTGNHLSGQIPNVFHQSNRFQELYLSQNYTGGNLTRLTSLHLSLNNLDGSIPSSLLTLPQLTFLDLTDNHLSGQLPNVFHQSNRFQELHMGGNYIGGELPSSLSNLQHLILLDLADNKFSSEIPDVFGGLTKLETLCLDNNNLGGQIPSSLFDLRHLSELSCSHNKLEGPLPNKITGFSNITQLRLNNNLLNGTIPSWCLSLPLLWLLDLSSNQFDGFSNSLFVGQTSAISSDSLGFLFLNNNKLQGNIPDSIFNLVNLTQLYLSSNRLSGHVNFSLFSNLEKLENLSLSDNCQLSLDFESSVNYSCSSLMELELSSLCLTEFPKLSGKFPILISLDLSNNKLHGRVPNWLHEMEYTLSYLKLSQNFLTTSTLDQFAKSRGLGYLDLSFNSLASDISSSICNASSLRILNLSNNKLTGTIPQCITNLSFLSVLDLQMNNLHGSLPNTFSKNNGLRTLNLYGNQLEGLLPKSLANCTSLEVLNLGKNQLEDIFPNLLQTLPDLKVLVLRANKLHGPITNFETKNPFPSLIIFDISCNNFSGLIPKSYIKGFKGMKNIVPNVEQYMQKEAFVGTYTDSVIQTIKEISITLYKIPTIFVNIDLSKNKFEGGIPDVIGELHVLKGLNLSHNRLSGPIPKSIANLTNLESLDLSSNMLTGGIPIELTNLNYLEILNLSQNHLVGEIPQGKQFNTFLNDSYKGNLGLCGLPLSIKCSNGPEQHSPPSSTFQHDNKFEFGWKPVAIGYGCGFVFGVGIGCCVLLIGKPQWLVRMVGGKPNKRVKKRITRMRTHGNCGRMN